MYFWLEWSKGLTLSATARWFYYPADDQALTVIASASTRINSNLLVRWRDLPLAPGAVTTEVELRWERSAIWSICAAWVTSSKAAR